MDVLRTNCVPKTIRYRRARRQVERKRYSQKNVINVIAKKVEDYSAWAGALDRNSRDFR